MEDDARYAARMADAAGGSFSRGVAAVAYRKILKLANASAKLCQREQDAARLKIAHERLRQHERHLLLMRDKHQRDTVAILLEYLADARAKEIEASDCDYEEKIELLGHYMYADLWEPRYFPPLPSEALAKEGPP
jgi:hypothetical protein